MQNFAFSLVKKASMPSKFAPSVGNAPKITGKGIGLPVLISGPGGLSPRFGMSFYRTFPFSKSSIQKNYSEYLFA
jgi:hypothetical protein